MTTITSQLRRVKHAVSSDAARSRRRAADHKGVHFHIDGTGRAFVCDFAGCDSASLTLGEATATQASARRWARR